MVVIADITVSSGTFPLGRVLDEFPDVEIELERIVPLQEAIVPLFWIGNVEHEAIKKCLLEHSKTKTVDVLTVNEEKTLFEVRWSADINGLIGALVDNRARILEATGTADQWDFRLRFATHDDLSSFNMALTNAGIPVTLNRIYNPSLPDDESSLSVDQRKLLRTAYREGYFEVPRRTTQTQLADSMEISDSAISQRLRRGIKTLVGQTLFNDDDDWSP